MSFRNVCFTVNNPPENSTIEWPDYVQYGVFQLERGENGTLHWQGYAELTKVVRLGALKQWLPTAHFEKRRGTDVQARDYCMKQDATYVAGPWEHGTFVPAAQTQGKRRDIDDVKEAILAGASKRQVYEEYGSVASRCGRYVETMLQFAREDRMREAAPEFVVRYPWQQRVLDYVAAPVHPRQILWIHDPFGGAGKSLLARHLACKHDAFYSTGGKVADVALAYDYQSTVVFDFARETEGFVSYAVMEQLKNGMMFSGKYESCMKMFAPCRVIVFANFRPADGKFSSDRLLIIELNSVHLEI